MALNKLSVCLLVAALFAVHVILADDDAESRRIRWPSGFSLSIQRSENLGNDRLSHEEREKRSPSSLPFLPTFGSCNYDVDPGLSCADCSTARLCLPNNMSITTTCGALFPNCNGGVCSSSPSRSCSENNS